MYPVIVISLCSLQCKKDNKQKQLSKLVLLRLDRGGPGGWIISLMCNIFSLNSNQTNILYMYTLQGICTLLKLQFNGF